MPPLPITPIQFTGDDEKKLLVCVEEEVRRTKEDHDVRTKYIDVLRRAYKAKPEQAVKNFPWPNASNIVVPLIGMAVDAIVARFMRAMLGAKDFAEVEIKARGWDFVSTNQPGPDGHPVMISMEKEVRDWISSFVKSSGARDALRSLFHDIGLLGDGFIKPIWVSETRIYHAYNSSGQITELQIPEYEGVRWHVPAPEDIMPPRGFDSWQNLPWVCNILRYTWDELQTLVEDQANGYKNISKLGETFLDKSGKRPLKQTDSKMRDDIRYTTAVELSHLGSVGPSQVFEFYELAGRFQIQYYGTDGKLAGSRAEEVILTYSKDYDLFIRAIHNPFFGKARHLVRVPFLVLPHEIYSMGIGEQILQFQEEASTSHNQVIDSGTAANAGIIAVTDEATLGNDEAIYPGKKIVTPNPDKDVRVYHLGADSRVLGMMEDRAVKYAETRSGVSSYHLGMESPTVGSRATATGTTALISEGNIRFWMSIDDMRAAIEEVLYLTIQLEQQMRPEGYEWAPGRFIKFPQGDVRTSLGLKLFLTSERINKDIEIQSLMMLLQVLNDYYMRLMQAAAVISNPNFPQSQKLTIIQVMDASQKIIQRFVERFDIEDIDQIVPGLMNTMNNAMGVINGLGIQNMAQGAPAGTPPPDAGQAAAGAGIGSPIPSNGTGV